MNKILIIFALFPFLHGSSYQVEYVSCKKDEIVVKHEDKDIKISLFNTLIKKDEGWDKTCEILKKANKLHIEIDPSSKIEEVLPVYLFADDKLVQEELMKQALAYPMIKNPEYTYEKELEEASDTTQTMAKPVKESVQKGHVYVAPLYLGGALLIWACMLGYVFFCHKKKSKKTSKKQL